MEKTKTKNKNTLTKNEIKKLYKNYQKVSLGVDPGFLAF